jgi:hypothetical protein
MLYATSHPASSGSILILYLCLCFGISSRLYSLVTSPMGASCLVHLTLLRLSASNILGRVKCKFCIGVIDKSQDHSAKPSHNWRVCHCMPGVFIFKCRYWTIGSNCRTYYQKNYLSVTDGFIFKSVPLVFNHQGSILCRNKDFTLYHNI